MRYWEVSNFFFFRTRSSNLIWNLWYWIFQVSNFLLAGTNANLYLGGCFLFFCLFPQAIKLLQCPRVLTQAFIMMLNYSPRFLQFYITNINMRWRSKGRDRWGVSTGGGFWFFLLGQLQLISTFWVPATVTVQWEKVLG